MVGFHIRLRTVHTEFDQVLDFGNGPGTLLYALPPNSEKWNLEPHRSNKPFLDYLDAKILGNLSKLPSNYFPTVVASHRVEHLPPELLGLTLGTLVQSLREGGSMLIEVPQGSHMTLELGARQDPHSILFTPRGLLAAVQEAGGTPVFAEAYAQEIPKPRTPALAKFPSVATANRFTRPPHQAADTNPSFLNEARGQPVVIPERKVKQSKRKLL